MKIDLSVGDLLLICQALDFYGDKVADTTGYSAGEKYWDLAEELKEKM